MASLSTKLAANVGEAIGEAGGRRVVKNLAEEGIEGGGKKTVKNALGETVEDTAQRVAREGVQQNTIQVSKTTLAPGPNGGLLATFFRNSGNVKIPNQVMDAVPANQVPQYSRIGDTVGDAARQAQASYKPKKRYRVSSDGTVAKRFRPSDTGENMAKRTDDDLKRRDIPTQKVGVDDVGRLFDSTPIRAPLQDANTGMISADLGKALPNGEPSFLVRLKDRVVQTVGDEIIDTAVDATKNAFKQARTKKFAKAAAATTAAGAGLTGLGLLASGIYDANGDGVEDQFLAPADDTIISANEANSAWADTGEEFQIKSDVVEQIPMSTIPSYQELLDYQQNPPDRPF